jgi:hypothetical protein
MNNARPVVLLLTAVLIAQSGCDKSVNPVEGDVRLEQIPGCKSGQLSKGLADSCFAYVFNDVLDIYFCASANCCPDTNRFRMSYDIRRDSIVVTIADTAAHLCRCNCTYMLRAQFRDLPGDSYRFVCRREDYSSQLIFYSVIVHR